MLTNATNTYTATSTVAGDDYRGAGYATTLTGQTVDGDQLYEVELINTSQVETEVEQEIVVERTIEVPGEAIVEIVVENDAEATIQQEIIEVIESIEDVTIEVPIEVEVQQTTVVTGTATRLVP